MKIQRKPLYLSTILIALVLNSASAGITVANVNFDTAPLTQSGSLVRDTNTKNEWTIKTATDVFYDAANHWVENNSDARTAGSLMQVIGNAPTYTAGNYNFTLGYTNDEIVTGAANTQSIDWGVFGITGSGSWGTTDNISIGGLGTASIPTNATALLTGTIDLSLSHPAVENFVSDSFTIAAGYDDIIIRINTLGVGAGGAGTAEFIRIHSVDIVPVPEPSVYAFFLGLAALGIAFIRRSK